MAKQVNQSPEVREPFLFRYLEPAEKAPDGRILNTLSPEDKPRPPEPTKKTPWGD